MPEARPDDDGHHHPNKYFVNPRFGSTVVFEGLTNECDAQKETERIQQAVPTYRQSADGKNHGVGVPNYT